MASAAPETRVIVHAGYHKTGTTSLQDFLKLNRASLAPYLRSYGKLDFLAAGAHARIYAQRPFLWRRWRFRRAFRAFLDGIEDGGTVVISRESFSGGMPGHHRIGGRLITSYHSSAATLAKVIVAELRRRFGTEVGITFFYTTREREAWIRSVHGHLLRSIRLTDDFKTFRARFPNLKSPHEEALEMVRVLAPVPVVTAALEDHADRPEGPAGALLDLLELPASLRANLQPAPRSNTGQPLPLREEFRQLNASDLEPAALRQEKEKLAREAQR